VWDGSRGCFDNSRKLRRPCTADVLIASPNDGSCACCYVPLPLRGGFEEFAADAADDKFGRRLNGCSENVL
jgi:hypothetical protein